MNLADFTKLIENIEDDQERTRKLYKLGVDISDAKESHCAIQNALIKEAFGEDGAEWIQWFCLEKDFGRRTDLTATDENGKEICRNVEELWELVEGKRA